MQWTELKVKGKSITKVRDTTKKHNQFGVYISRIPKEIEHSEILPALEPHCSTIAYHTYNKGSGKW